MPRLYLYCKLLLYLILACTLPACSPRSPTPVPTPTLPIIKDITDNITVTEKLQEIKERNPALSSILNEFIMVYQQEGKEAAIKLARERNILDAQDNLPLTVVLDTKDAAVLQELSAKAEARGCIVLGYLGNELEILVPLAVIEQYESPDAQQTVLDELAALEHVRNIKLTTFMAPLSTIEGEGVEVTGAAAWHEQDYRGQGVKVGVLDYGFDGYKNLLDDELPAAVTVESFSRFGAADEAGTPHGTAVGEIIHELAPDATLYFACIDGYASSFANGARWLADQGVQIINHSGGFPDGPFDGSNPEDELVDEIAARGILWINAAGNDGDAHWRGMFSDTDNDGFHNFPPDDDNFLPVYGMRGVQLHWWANPGEDYDVYVFDEFGFEIASSLDDQKAGVPPVEITERFSSILGMVYYVAIKAEQEARPVILDLFVSNGEIYADVTIREYSVANPATARSALAVGATWWRNDKLLPYSSGGPTSDGRIKPDIAAPSEVRNRSYSPETFGGTSAAAPHIAGVAALVLGRYPEMTTEELRNYLLNHTQDLGAAGADNEYGYGRVALPNPAAQVAPTATALPPTAPPTSIPPTAIAQISATPAPATAAPIQTETTQAVPDEDEDDTDDNTMWIIAIVATTLATIGGILFFAFRGSSASVSKASDVPQIPSIPAYQPPATPLPPTQEPGYRTADTLYPLSLVTKMGQQYNLQSGVNTIGRSSTCTIKLADDQVSRQHARLSVSGAQVTVEDLSTNGTYINGRKIAAPMLLTPGDTLRCGRTMFTLQGAGEASIPGGIPEVTGELIESDGTKRPLIKAITTIGRSSTCDLPYRDSQISRVHAKIEIQGATFILVDMKSANGTFVNQQPVEGRTTLHNGDMIHLGNTQLLFRVKR